MSDFRYVPKKEYMPVKRELIELIKDVQDKVRDEFTFKFDFVGSAKRNMITKDYKSNVGYDFDVNIQVNDPNDEYSAEEIRHIMKNAFDKVCLKYGYDYAEDSSRVLTIKVKDRQNSRILHSCDFAIVYNCSDGRQQYIRFNKNQHSYAWVYQPKGFYKLSEKIEWIKRNNLWQEVTDAYIQAKNNNKDPHKKSRSIFAEVISRIYNEN